MFPFCALFIKVATTDTKYFAMNRFLKSLIHKKAWLDMTSSFQVRILINIHRTCQRREDTALCLDEPGKKTRMILIPDNFVSKP